ncbi:MAG: beta-lactamase family protein [Oscillospiraceae bacterium]|nr:beta-lactamase family protein [Oscillospiraceae bacterium]
MKKHISKRNLLIIIAIILVAAAAIFISLAAYGKYRMSLIPKMSSQEILDYTLKDNEKGIITVGIIKDGKASYSVYGKDGKQLDNELHTYEIGSLTKTVTASLINKAVIEGKIDIDGSVDKYIELPAKEHYPTIRELLTHTSGYKPYYLEGVMIKYHFSKNNDFYGVGDSDIITRLEKENIVGKDYPYNYSNFGYAVLGLVLEKVYATEYTTLVNDYLHNELGMKNTKISEGDGDLGNYWEWQPGDTYLAAGGITSDIEDMLIYARLQLDEDETWKNAHTALKLFDANSESYKALGIRIDGTAYGWICDTESGFLWHNGGTSDYNAYLGFSTADDTAVVVLSNLSPDYRIPATVLGRKIMGELTGK